MFFFASCYKSSKMKGNTYRHIVVASSLVLRLPAGLSLLLLKDASFIVSYGI